MVALSRQHFIQTIEALRVGRTLKVNQPSRELKLPKKNPKLKTVYLDLDETLIHCDEQSNNYTVKLDFPVEGGSTISVPLMLLRQASAFVRIAQSSSGIWQPLPRSSSSRPAAPPMQTSSLIILTLRKSSSAIDCTASTARSRKDFTPKIYAASTADCKTAFLLITPPSRTCCSQITASLFFPTTISTRTESCPFCLTSSRTSSTPTT